MIRSEKMVEFNVAGPTSLARRDYLGMWPATMGYGADWFIMIYVGSGFLNVVLSDRFQCLF